MTFHIFVGPKQTISHYHETLGEALQGTELEFSGLEIEFKGKHRILVHLVRFLSFILRVCLYKIPYSINFRKREENRVLLSNSRRDQIKIIHVRSQQPLLVSNVH